MARRERPESATGQRRELLKERGTRQTPTPVATTALGRSETSQIKPALITASHNATEPLRAGTFEPSKGTWFGLRYVVDQSGEYHVSFDYDDEPEFDVALAHANYACDFARFPRDEAHMPSWLKGETGRCVIRPGSVIAQVGAAGQGLRARCPMWTLHHDSRAIASGPNRVAGVTYATNQVT